MKKKHHYLTRILTLALAVGCFSLTSAAVPVQSGIRQVYTEQENDDEADGNTDGQQESSSTEVSSPEESSSEETSPEESSPAESSSEESSPEESSPEETSPAESSSEGQSPAEPSPKETPSEPATTAAPTYYKVTVKGDHISVSGGDTVKAGDRVTVSCSDPEDGYQFDGWSVSGSSAPNNKNQQYTFTVEQDVTVTAVTSAITYTITYTDADDSGNITAYTILDSFQLSAPTREGYVFEGWTGTDLSAMTKNVTIPIGSTGNRSYTAHWSEATTEASTTTSAASASKVNLNIDLGDAPEKTTASDEELEMESSHTPITSPADEAGESSSIDEAALFTTTTDSGSDTSPLLIVVIAAIILVIIGIAVTVFSMIRNGAFGAQSKERDSLEDDDDPDDDDFEEEYEEDSDMDSDDLDDLDDFDDFDVFDDLDDLDDL